MRKHLILLAITISAAACSQQPAPVDVYGTRYYGKGGRGSVSSQPAVNNSDYNSRIDNENSTRILSRPLGGTRGAVDSMNSNPPNKSGEIYSHQLTDSSGIKSRALAPVAIDSDQQVVRVRNLNGPAVNSIHSGGSLGGRYADQDSFRETAQMEETVPPIEKKEGFINPPEANAERKSANNLSKVRPLPKPKYQEETEDTDTVETVAPAVPVKAEKPKITAKIQKVETSAGEIEKSTPVMAKKQELLAKQPAPEDEDIADDSDDEDVKVSAAAKPAPVKAAEGKPAEPEKTVAEESKQEPVTTLAKPAAKPAAQFIKPVDGVVIAEFGNDKSGSFNDGVNIQAPEGTPVKAASGGTVVYSGNQLQGYGNMIIIKHPNGYLSAYSHLKELEIKKGDNIEQGKVLGHVGKTGNVDTPQLHFGIRKGREPVDPKGYLSLNQ